MLTDALSQQAGDVVLMPAWSFALIGAAVLVSLGLGIAAGCCVFRRREKATGTALTTRNWRLSTVRGQQYAAKTNWSSVVELNVEPEVSEVCVAMFVLFLLGCIPGGIGGLISNIVLSLWGG